MRETMAVIGAALLGAGSLTWGATAQAQQQQIQPFFTYQPGPAGAAVSHPDVGYGEKEGEGGYRRTLPAPTNAFEMKVASGYTQGFGMIVPSTGVPSVAGAGIGVNVDLDYRMTPHSSLGVMGQYQEFTSENNSAARGLVGNLGYTYHGAPFMRADPWFRIATGYRVLWSVDPVTQSGIVLPTVAVHGFELAALTLGYDLRLAEAVAIAPMIGADLTMFTWADSNGINSRLSSVQVATFVFAGIQGRFDAGPSTGGTASVAKNRTPALAKNVF